jgi:exopolysaccharide biosynthesis polyprenyl glycosylphosphotransferase
LIRRHITALRLGLMAADGVSAIVLFFFISTVRFGATWPSVWSSADIEPLLAVVAYAGSWVALIWLFGLYQLRSRWSIRSEALDVTRAALLFALATFSALFVLKLPDVSRLFLVWLFVAQVVVTLSSRFVIRAILRALHDRGYNTRYAIVIGTGVGANRFAGRIARHRELGLRIIGHVAAPDEVEHAVPAGAILGTIDDLQTIFDERIVDEVAICLPPEQVGLVEPITRLCEDVGKVVRIPHEEYALTLPGAREEEFDRIRILSLVHGPDRVLGLIAKRVIDLVLGLVALVVLGPILLAVGLVIIAVDGRPIFFRQTRVGLHGRPFQVVKFRTMTPDAEARLAELEALNEVRGHAFKLTDDPRRTRTGRWLRATSIDELPQLWNVLLGEMSLVGPRPPLPREVAGYDLWHRRRLSMKPGITGLWQVQARNDADFDRWVALDLAYIDRWSIWLDLKIMIRTIPAMLNGR